MVSKKIRPVFKKYSTSNIESIPKKYKNYSIDKDGYLINPADNMKVLKNTKKAGQPRYYKLSGQDLWTFNIHIGTKSKVARELKITYYELFKDVNLKLNEKDFPIGISLEFHGKIENKEDIDNLARWHEKCILDALCGNVEYVKNEIKEGQKRAQYKADHNKYHPFIKDDNLSFIRELPKKFVESENEELLIIFYKI